MWVVDSSIVKEWYLSLSKCLLSSATRGDQGSQMITYVAPKEGWKLGVGIICEAQRHPMGLPVHWVPISAPGTQDQRKEKRTIATGTPSQVNVTGSCFFPLSFLLFFFFVFFTADCVAGLCHWTVFHNTSWEKEGNMNLKLHVSSCNRCLQCLRKI